MFLRQVYDPYLAQYAYVIGCQKTGEAMVIDPLRDVAQYQSIAAAEGLKLSAVAETHIHADFVSGARELYTQGLVVYVSAEGGKDWQSEWGKGLPNVHLLHDRDVFRIGNIKFEVMHTPGHTPEHVCYLITDEGGGANEPIALISGDFLFVGDVGRPDLLEKAAGIADTQETGARQLYHSLKKLESLPDYLQVLPAHGAGSACGKSLGAIPISTLGYEKRFNHALKLALYDTESAFISFILDGQPEPPLYFANMKRVNRIGPAILGNVSPLMPLNHAQVSERLNDSNFVVLDTRSDPVDFAVSHLQGSLYTPAQGDFSGFAGSYLMPDKSIVLLVENSSTVESLAWQLRRIGFDHLLGWLSTGALSEINPSNLRSVVTVKFDGITDLLRRDPDTMILDVRRANEHAIAHLRGAVNIAHTRLREHSSELPTEGMLVVLCQSGKRAASAIAWLQREGHKVIFVNDSFKNAPEELLE